MRCLKSMAEKELFDSRQTIMVEMLEFGRHHVIVSSYAYVLEMEESNSNRKKDESINIVEEVGEDDHVVNIHVSEEEEEDVESLKKRISGHPLYGLLLQAHLNCLKVGLGEVAEVGDPAANELNISTSSPDLDLFMVEYCRALGKLREAIQEPVEETASFINAMYIQLEDLNANGLPKTP